MTWQEILALSEDDLNRAIEGIEARRWYECNERPFLGWWHYTAPDGQTTYSSVPHLHTTASWDRCMPLALRYGVEYGTMSSVLCGADDAAIVSTGNIVVFAIATHKPEISGLCAEHPEHIRVALCRVALWVATQSQEVGKYGSEGLST